MATHLVGGLRLLAVTGFDHLILQTRRQCHHALLGRIGCEICLALGLILLETLRSGGTLLLLLRCKKLLYDSLGFHIRKLEVGTCQHVFDSQGEIINVEVCGTHIRQLSAYTKTQSITYFIHVIV